MDWPALTIVAFNNNTVGNQTLPFNLVGLPAITAVDPIRTSGTENWAALPAIPVSGTAFTATLPHQSITTFTSTLPALLLGIARTNNDVTLSWPVGAAGFILEATGELSSSNAWSTVTNTSAITGGQRIVAAAANAGKQFYRLRSKSK